MSAVLGAGCDINHNLFQVYSQMIRTHRILCSRPRVLAVLPRIMPSTIIGVAKPLKNLHRQGDIEVCLTIESLVSKRQVAGADLLVFSRNAEPARNRALLWARELRKPMIYELDDHLLAIPPDVHGAYYYSHPKRHELLRRYLQSANLVRVYSERLRQTVLSINPAVERVDGPVFWDLIPSHPIPRKPDGKIRIVYATSRRKDELEEIFLASMVRFLKDNADSVGFYTWGCRSAALTGLPSVKSLKFMSNYDRFFRKFACSGFDIGLAPLLDDEFHQSKSNLKFRDYAACRIAGIYSNVPVYAECVQDGITGLLVENSSEAWLDALTRLMSNKDLRSTIQNEAQQYARTHYNQDLFCRVWLDQIHRVLDQRLEASGRQMTASTHSMKDRTGGLKYRLADFAATFFSGLSRVFGLIRGIPQDGLGNAFDVARCAVKDWCLLRKIR